MKKALLIFLLLLFSSAPFQAAKAQLTLCLGQPNCLKIKSEFACEIKKTWFNINTTAPDSNVNSCRIVLDVYKLDSASNLIPATKKTRFTDGFCNESLSYMVPMEAPGSYRGIVTRFRRPVSNPSAPWFADLTDLTDFSVISCPIPTPYPVSSCVQIQALNSSGGVITNPASILVGDTVTFRSFWSPLAQIKKSIRYHIYRNNVLQPVVDVPAIQVTAPNGQPAYQGDYTTVINPGAYKVISHDAIVNF
ncbi:MAG: hypothetical protein G01um101416_879 [Microgenomates group bacterium Gr01-1014_16]|nr:MAG: hypothetical protein G01um101416_879 [Microgenomates group bacterium Gr01-1014_16]